MASKSQGMAARDAGLDAGYPLVEMGVMRVTVARCGSLVPREQLEALEGGGGVAVCAGALREMMHSVADNFQALKSIETDKILRAQKGAGAIQKNRGLKKGQGGGKTGGRPIGARRARGED